jgi:hypothetical protein
MREDRYPGKHYKWTPQSENCLEYIVERRGLPYAEAVKAINKFYPQLVPVTVCACIGKMNRMRKKKA